MAETHTPLARRADSHACLTLLSALLLTLMATRPARAETFTLTPSDDWSVLEAAQAGDVVEIEPGTYRFRVYLDQVGRADAPIVLRAKDPNNRPVWDLVGEGDDTLVDTWPDSYTAGDKHRGCWQVAPEGAYYQIEGIVFQNCRAPSSAGIRMINSGPVTLRDCSFQHNTNGLTGASTDLVVEHSEFFQNGKTITTGPATHHIYIFGGKFSLRYSYLHDGHEGQAFHVRARESVIEYNWITRPANYVGDIMSCEQFCGAEPHRQSMLLRGNVIVQGTPSNGSQLLTLFRDADANPAASMHLTLAYNTIIGTPRSGSHNLLNLRNDTVTTSLELYNNIVYDVGSLAELADPSASNWSIQGAGNWLTDGMAAAEDLTETVWGTDPGFADLSGSDFTLVERAAAKGAAVLSVPFTPDREYFRDESVAMAWRPRATAADIGAFESGNQASAVGARDQPAPEPSTPDATDAGAPSTAPDAAPPDPVGAVPVEPGPGGPAPVEPDPTGPATEPVPTKPVDMDPDAAEPDAGAGLATQPDAAPASPAPASPAAGDAGRAAAPMDTVAQTENDSSSCACGVPGVAASDVRSAWALLGALAWTLRRNSGRQRHRRAS